MIHFALPQSHFGQPVRLLDRDVRLAHDLGRRGRAERGRSAGGLLLRPSGDARGGEHCVGEQAPGIQCLFPMPFRRSARIELLYDGPVEPGEELWRLMPCLLVRDVPRPGESPQRCGVLPCELAAGRTSPGRTRLPRPARPGRRQVRGLECEHPTAGSATATRSMPTRSSTSTVKRRLPSSSRGSRIRSGSVGVFRRRRASSRSRVSTSS